MPFSVRLDPETERLIVRLAREARVSRSHVVREAVVAYGADNSKGESAYDRFKRTIGMVDSGGLQLSTESGEKVRAILKAKSGKGSRRYRSPRRRSGSK